LRQANLANLAFAYERLAEFARRIQSGALQGTVLLKQADAENDRPWPTLTALHGSQAALEEHFTEEDVIDLSDVLDYALEASEEALTFDLADIRSRFLPPVRQALVQAGIAMDELPPNIQKMPGLSTSACEDEEN